MLQQKLKKGKTSALEEIYKIYFPQVYAVAFKYVKNESIALDLVQDSFLKIWRNRENISLELSLEQQLFVITKNVVFDFFRSKINEEKLLKEYKISQEFSQLPSTSAEDEGMKNLHKLLKKLPTRQQEVFTMVKFQGLSYEEVAVKLKISPNTVSNHFSAAMKFLKKNMQLFLILLALD